MEKPNGFIEVLVFFDLSVTFDTFVNRLVSPFFQVLELVLGSLTHYNLFKNGPFVPTVLVTNCETVIPKIYHRHLL